MGRLQYVERKKGQSDSDVEFHFQCESVLDTNDWLRKLRRISNMLKKDKKHISKNDLDLVTTPKITKSNTMDDDINVLYMKAVNLYQNKHYDECAAVLKSVLK